MDEATFETDVIERSAERPVVVDFWAEWCGPCHALTPVLERATAERDIQLAKVDVDANKDLADRYGVRGIPAVKAFRNGHVVAEFVGAQSPATVEQFLDDLNAPSEALALVEELGLEDVAEALASGDHEQALERLLEEVRSSPDGRREVARRAMLAVFRELGQENPVVKQYRRRLATTLY